MNDACKATLTEGLANACRTLREAVNKSPRSSAGNRENRMMFKFLEGPNSHAATLGGLPKKGACGCRGQSYGNKFVKLRDLPKAKVTVIEFVPMNLDRLIVLRSTVIKLPFQIIFMARFIYPESRRKKFAVAAF